MCITLIGGKSTRTPQSSNLWYLLGKIINILTIFTAVLILPSSFKWGQPAKVRNQWFLNLLSNHSLTAKPAEYSRTSISGYNTFFHICKWFIWLCTIIIKINNFAGCNNSLFMVLKHLENIDRKMLFQKIFLQSLCVGMDATLDAT